tara:strand:- start:730 stop:2481 length:1752 start_codon:yes stop_codon:yes gene_type:complete
MSLLWVLTNSITFFLLETIPVSISGVLKTNNSGELIVGNQIFNSAGNSDLIKVNCQPNEKKEFDYEYQNGNILKEQKGIFIYNENNGIKVQLELLNFNSWIFSHNYTEEELYPISKLVKREHDDNRKPIVEENSLTINPDEDIFIFSTKPTFYKPFWNRVYLTAFLVSCILSILIILRIRTKFNRWLNSQSINTVFQLSSVFLVILFFAFAPKTYDTPEKRNLKEFPSFSNTFIWNIPGKIDAWYKDHFPFRNSLPVPINYLKLSTFNISPIPQKVLKGKENWLFSSEGDVVDSYKGLKFYSDDELKKIKHNLEERRDYLKLKGSSYHLMILPLKASMYPEMLPNVLKAKSSYSKYEQLISYLKENTTLSIVEVKPKLLEKKEAELLYYETDTHWNQLGGFYGYQQLIKKINSDTEYNITLIDEDQISYEKYTESSGDLLNMINLTGYLNRTIYQLKLPYRNEKEVPPIRFDSLRFDGPLMCYENSKLKSAPRILFYRDSFSSYLIKPVSQSFSRTALYWTRTFYKEPIDAENPDIFVDEYLERFLDFLLDENPKSIQNAVKEFRASQQADSLHNSTLPELLD